MNDWLELRQHADTGIETIKAHFEGHAYDLHWHDSYLVGITLSGTQQFHCRRKRYLSHPGDAFLLEPGEIHDGDAPVAGGFTYVTFYLDERWLLNTLHGLYEATPGSYSLHFSQILTREPQLAHTIGNTFAALHNDEMKIVQQSTMDNLLAQLTSHSHWRKKLPSQLQSAAVAQRWRIGRGTISMPIWATISACPIWPGRPAPIASRSPAALSESSTWRRMPGSFNCVWPKRGSFWRVGISPSMWRRRWGLPIKAIWAAGSSGLTVSRLPTTVGCAQTFQTFPENSGTVRTLIIRSHL